jgi:competence protein ComEC
MMRNSRTKYIAALSIVLILTTAACSGRSPEGGSVSPSAGVSSAPVQIPGETIPIEGFVTVLFINAGRADSALLKAGNKYWLIDTGEKSSIPEVFRALNYFGVNTLEGIFLSHTHSDHIGGLRAIAQNYSVEKLYSARISEDEEDGGNKIEELARDLNLEHIKLEAGNMAEIEEGIRFEVLGPISQNYEDDNDNSLVLRLTANGRTFLFTGDMQFSEEKTLHESGADLSADILKVGNHGNPDATSDEFASAVSPKFAVISTDTAEDTDSANERVIKALKGAEILVTEDFILGAAVTVSENGSITVSDPEPRGRTSDIGITKLDKETQTVSIRNYGSDADISGYFLYSKKGSEIFVFPEGSILRKNEAATVACAGGKGDYFFTEGKVWSKKDDEAAILYDRYGNELSVLQ